MWVPETADLYAIFQIYLYHFYITYLYNGKFHITLDTLDDHLLRIWFSKDNDKQRQNK